VKETFPSSFASDGGRRDIDAGSVEKAAGAGVDAAGGEVIAGADALGPTEVEVAAAVVRAAEDIDR
jgi:hypothetical protein